MFPSSSDTTSESRDLSEISIAGAPIIQVPNFGPPLSQSNILDSVTDVFDQPAFGASEKGAEKRSSCAINSPSKRSISSRASSVDLVHRVLQSQQSLAVISTEVCDGGLNDTACKDAKSSAGSSEGTVLATNAKEPTGYPVLDMNYRAISKTKSSLLSKASSLLRLGNPKKYVMSQRDVWGSFFGFILLFQILTFCVLLIPVYNSEVPSQVNARQLGYLSLSVVVAIFWSIQTTLLVPHFQWSSFLGSQQSSRPLVFCCFLVGLYTCFILLFNLVTMSTGVFPIRYLTGWMPAISYVPVVYGVMWLYWTMSDQSSAECAASDVYPDCLQLQHESMRKLKRGFGLFVKLNLLNTAFYGVAQGYVIITFAMQLSAPVQIPFAILYKAISIPLKLLIRQYSIEAGRYLYPPLKVNKVSSTTRYSDSSQPESSSQESASAWTFFSFSFKRQVRSPTAAYGDSPARSTNSGKSPLTDEERKFTLEPHEFAKLMTNWSHAVDCFFSMMVFLYIRAWYFTSLVILMELVLATAFPYFDKIQDKISLALSQLKSEATATGGAKIGKMDDVEKSSESTLESGVYRQNPPIIKSSEYDEPVAEGSMPDAVSLSGVECAGGIARAEDYHDTLLLDATAHTLKVAPTSPGRLSRTNALQLSAPDINTSQEPLPPTISLSSLSQGELGGTHFGAHASTDKSPLTTFAGRTVQRRHSLTGGLFVDRTLSNASRGGDSKAGRVASNSTLQKFASQVRRLSTYGSLSIMGSSTNGDSLSRATRKRAAGLRLAAPQIILKSLSRLIPTYFSVHDRIEIVFSNLFIIFLAAVTFVPWSLWMRYGYNNDAYNAPFRKTCYEKFNQSMIIAGVEIAAVLIYMVLFEFWVQHKVSTGASTNEGMPLKNSMSASKHLHATLTDQGKFSLWRTGLQSLRYKFWLFLAILLNAGIFPIITLLDQNSILTRYDPYSSSQC